MHIIAQRAGLLYNMPTNQTYDVQEYLNNKVIKSCDIYK